MTPLLPPEVLFADEYNRPVFQMGPYDADAMARNLDLVRAASGAPAPDLSAWPGTSGVATLTVNGREAIGLALDDLDLDPDDEVLILTTTGGPYVSRCVTDAVARRCRCARSLGARTRAVVVIHEFGFPASLPPEVAARGLPVIEDCAYAMGTMADDGTTGRLGDYVVYSFSKALPLPYGGLLISPRPPRRTSALSAQARVELPVLAAHYLAEREAAFAKRREVFERYRARFAAEGFRPLLEPAPGIVPHSFIVALPDQAKAEAMKPRLHAVGVISSVFYGGGGYFLPNHQRLGEAAVDYIVAHFLAAHRDS